MIDNVIHIFNEKSSLLGQTYKLKMAVDIYEIEGK